MTTGTGESEGNSYITSDHVFHPLNQGKQSDSSFPSRVLHPDRGEIGGFKVRVPKGGKKKSIRGI